MFANVTFCSKDECMFESFYALLKDLALEVGFLLRLRLNKVKFFLLRTIVIISVTI